MNRRRGVAIKSTAAQLSVEVGRREHDEPIPCTGIDDRHVVVELVVCRGVTVGDRTARFLDVSRVTRDQEHTAVTCPDIVTALGLELDLYNL
jgi:hypothetical protein